eukprot:26267-Heterocapsa_arctica.AAC.1
MTALLGFMTMSEMPMGAKGALDDWHAKQTGGNRSDSYLAKIVAFLKHTSVLEGSRGRGSRG